MFLHVTEVTYLQAYRLRLTFNDGVIKDVDLEAELYGTVNELGICHQRKFSHRRGA